MEEIDKLLDLFKVGEIELMWQLSKSLGINGIELWTNIYNEFKDDEGDLAILPGLWIYRYTYNYELKKADKPFGKRFDILEEIILELIEYLDGELR